MRIAAAPVDGAANAELIDTLARALDLPRRAVTITAGATSRTKRVHVDGLSRDERAAARAASICLSWAAARRRLAQFSAHDHRRLPDRRRGPGGDVCGRRAAPRGARRATSPRCRAPRWPVSTGRIVFVGPAAECRHAVVADRAGADPRGARPHGRARLRRSAHPPGLRRRPARRAAAPAGGRDLCRDRRGGRRHRQDRGGDARGVRRRRWWRRPGHDWRDAGERHHHRRGRRAATA